MIGYSRGRQAGRQHTPGAAARPLRLDDGGGVSPLRPRTVPANRRVKCSPARIGHYAIARKLGEGGMGVVYAARDERLERRVALKTMSSLATDETARKRFWREARAAASVNHPNICQIYEIGEDERRAVHRDGAARRRGAGRAAAARAAERRRGGADRPRDAGRALGAARPRHRPPRPQAVQRVPDRRTA